MSTSEIVAALHERIREDKRDAAELVLRACGDTRVVEHGSFMSKLTEAALVADQGNLDKIAEGFPFLVAAIKTYRHEPGGKAELEKRAGIS